MSDLFESEDEFSDYDGVDGVVYAVNAVDVTADVEDEEDDDDEEVQQAVAKVMGKMVWLKSQLKKSRQENRILETQQDDLALSKATIASLKDEQKNLKRQLKHAKAAQEELKKSVQEYKSGLKRGSKANAALKEENTTLKEENSVLKEELIQTNCSAMLLSLMLKVGAGAGQGEPSDLEGLLRKAGVFLQSDRFKECSTSREQIHRFLLFCSMNNVWEVSKKASQEVKARWYGQRGPLSSHGVDVLFS